MQENPVEGFEFRSLDDFYKLNVDRSHIYLCKKHS